MGFFRRVLYKQEVTQVKGGSVVLFTTHHINDYAKKTNVSTSHKNILTLYINLLRNFSEMIRKTLEYFFSFCYTYAGLVVHNVIFAVMGVTHQCEHLHTPNNIFTHT